jgi:hypothetical protein
MSVKNLYPNIEPTLNLSFALTKALDPRIGFARASTARAYDGKTVAKAEENLFRHSQEFDNAYWTKNNATVTANSTAAPDGTTTAETLAVTSAGTGSRISAAIGGGFSGTNTISIFAKADTKTVIQVCDNIAATAFVNFDLSGGAVGSTGGGATGVITALANGWYRCSATFTWTNEISFHVVDSSTSVRREAPATTGALFVWGAQLEQRDAVTAYTPTTTQPITNYVPVLLSAANNVARFDHDPVSGESLGLLIEEQRTNLLERSEEFDNAYWTKTNSTVTANTIVAPDGTLTADTLIENTSNAEHFVVRGGNILQAGVRSTISVYAKSAGRNLNIVGVNRDLALPRVRFNLSTGVTTVLTNSANLVVHPMVNVGNGWWRCSITIDGGTGGTVSNIAFQLDTGLSFLYTGDGYSGIYIWGAQLEAGAFPTSYIPTTTAQVTRSADAASMTGANFSSWYRQDQGSFYAEAQSATDGPDVVVASDATTSNRFGLLSLTTLQARVTRNGIPSSADAGTPTAGFNKIAGSASVSDGVVAALNGATSAAASISTMPPLNTLYIGSGASGLFTVGTLLHIRKIAYYPKRIANAELQALTQN